MTYKDIEKTGMYFHGAEPCSSPTIAGWALGDLGDPSLEAYRIVSSPDTSPVCLLVTVDIRLSLQRAAEGGKDDRSPERAPPMYSRPGVPRVGGDHGGFWEDMRPYQGLLAVILVSTGDTGDRTMKGGTCPQVSCSPPMRAHPGLFPQAMKTSWP